MDKYINIEDVKQIIISNMSNQILEYINRHGVYYDFNDCSDETDIIFDNLSFKNGIDYIKAYNNQSANNDFWYELALEYEDLYTLYSYALNEAKENIKYKLPFFELVYYGNNKEKIVNECYNNYLTFKEENNIRYTKSDFLKMIEEI